MGKAKVPARVAATHSPAGAGCFFFSAVIPDTLEHKIYFGEVRENSLEKR